MTDKVTVIILREKRFFRLWSEVNRVTVDRWHAERSFPRGEIRYNDISKRTFTYIWLDD